MREPSDYDYLYLHNSYTPLIDGDKVLITDTAEGEWVGRCYL